MNTVILLVFLYDIAKKRAAIDLVWDESEGCYVRR